MTVTFVVGGTEEQVPNHLVMSSEYIKNLLVDLNATDITIEIKKEYIPIFNIYLAFLYGNLNPHGGIKNVNTLISCFKMESFFIDGDFFEYLMDQAHSLWDQFVPLISQTPDERLVYLYSPYEFVPTKYMDRDTFFNEWLKINSNINIVLNGNAIYYTNTIYYDKDKKYIKELNTYHTINGKKVGYEHKEEWHDTQGEMTEQRYYSKNYENGEENGLQEEWYQNGQRYDIGNYENGEKNGLQEAWYENGQPRFILNYKDGRYDGIQQVWYDNGHRYYITNYKNGKKDGLREEWYQNGRPKYKENYNDDKKDGLQEYWNERGKLIDHKLYIMGEYIRNLPLS